MCAEPRRIGLQAVGRRIREYSVTIRGVTRLEVAVFRAMVTMIEASIILIFVL